MHYYQPWASVGIAHNCHSSTFPQDRVHEGKRPFKCFECDSTFKLKCDLKNHTQSVHEGKKAHTCTICQKGFAKKGNLNRHVKEHEGKKAHTCNICQKSFSQKGNMKRHVKDNHEKTGKASSYSVMTVHNEKRRFKCSLCDKLFILEKSLNSHARSVHEGKQPNIPSKGNHEGTKNANLCFSNIPSNDWIYGYGYVGTTTESKVL